MKFVLFFSPIVNTNGTAQKGNKIVNFLEFWVMFGSLLAFQMTHQLLFVELIGSCLATNEIG